MLNLRILALAVITSFACLSSIGQTCKDDYFLVKYQTSTVQHFGKAIYNAKKEIAFAGTVIREGSHVALDGWFTRLSAQGTILSTRIYSSVFYNYIKFNKVIQADGENYLLVGNIGNVDTTKVPPPIYTQYGFIVKVDKHGNIIWSRMFGKNFVTNLATDINNIVSTGTGDFILSLDYSNTNAAAIIVRIDKDGNIKWTTTVSSTDFLANYSPASITPSRHGDILIAQKVILYDRTSFSNSKYGYYLLSLDSAAGNRNWERLFIYADSLSSTKAVEDVANLTELPNGDISFISSYADSAYIYFHNSSKVINFVTDNIGRLKKIIQYQTHDRTLYASAATDNVNGDRLVLMDNADAPMLMKINSDGGLLWANAYPKTGRSQESRSVISSAEGNYFFSFTHNGGPTDLSLVRTDVAGNIDCIQAPLDIVSSDATSRFVERKIPMTVDQAPGKWYSISALGTGDYKMSASVQCKKVCCTESIQTTIQVDVCNQPSYTLPDSYVATVGGLYQITYKAASGCDSMVYYNVKFSYTPTINLGQDECLTGKDSIVLSVPDQYSSYSWNGVETGRSSMVVRRPGKYVLIVRNGCGIASDTIQVYQDCAFEVFVPSAFTPNNDNHNDYFILPSLNKNRLVRLSVYNRWGQMVFSTTDQRKGWDGKKMNALQPAGTYIYSLEMETLDGKRIHKNGTFILIR
jgi:gliding motility-associated-like protein